MDRIILLIVYRLCGTKASEKLNTIDNIYKAEQGFLLVNIHTYIRTYIHIHVQIKMFFLDKKNIRYSILIQIN